MAVLPSFKTERVGVLLLLIFIFFAVMTLRARKKDIALTMLMLSAISSIAVIIILTYHTSYVGTFSFTIALFMGLCWIILLVVIKNQFSKPIKVFMIAVLSSGFCMLFALSMLVCTSETKVFKDYENGVVYITKIDPVNEQTYGVAIVRDIKPAKTYDC